MNHAPSLRHCTKMDAKPCSVMLHPTANPFSCKPRRTRSILRRWPGGNVIPRIRKRPRCEFRADSTISSTVEQKVMSPDFMKRAIVLALENVRTKFATRYFSDARNHVTPGPSAQDAPRPSRLARKRIGGRMEHYTTRFCIHFRGVAEGRGLSHNGNVSKGDRDLGRDRRGVLRGVA